MSIINIIFEPAIIIISLSFLFFILLVIKEYLRVKSNLSSVYSFLRGLSKKEISYRFSELDNFMSTRMYTSSIWEDFKKALIYPERLYIHSQNAKTSEICLTVDSSYFFNEDTLILSKINHKFIQTIPTILTGLGPFFTFLKMAIAFSAVNFTLDSQTTAALNSLISNIQIAALCSVFAVGFSLLFMLTEKILYNKMCKKYYILIQNELIRIFDVVTSEKFLIDLLAESKMQNSRNEQLVKKLPEDLSNAINESLKKTAVPYMENILYSLNKINEAIGKNNGGDIVDKLF